MNRKSLVTTLLGMICLFSCDSSYQDDLAVQEKIKYAQFIKLKDKRGFDDLLSLPRLSKGDLKTRGIDIAAVNAMWEEASIVPAERPTLVVPIKPEEEMRARFMINLAGKITIHDVKMYSKLVVRQFGDDKLVSVITHLPEEEFAAKNEHVLAKMYHPNPVKYDGLSIVSTPEGNLVRVFYYKKGRLVSKVNMPGSVTKNGMQVAQSADVIKMDKASSATILSGNQKVNNRKFQTKIYMYKRSDEENK